MVNRSKINMAPVPHIILLFSRHTTAFGSVMCNYTVNNAIQVKESIILWYLDPDDRSINIPRDEC